jgi:polysaccharide biosynthesis/export protein
MYSVRNVCVIVGLCITFAFSSCKTQNMFSKKADNQRMLTAADSLLLVDTAYQYTIRKDDKISISVWGHDELSVGSTYGIYNSNEVYGKWLMVDAQGIIELPQFGSMYVEHYTIPQLKQMLRDTLSKLLLHPVIDIKILNKEISLLGEFRDPASVVVDKERNYLLDMVAKVGGFEHYANLSCIKVFRQKGKDTHMLNIDLTTKGSYMYKNIVLYPGDIVIAPSKSYKEFDKRVSTIIPFTSALTSAAIFLKAF